MKRTIFRETSIKTIFYHVFIQSVSISKVEKGQLQRSWTIFALRTIILYFWSNIELTWQEHSFMPPFTNCKEIIMRRIKCLPILGPVKIGLILPIWLVSNSKQQKTKIYFNFFYICIPNYFMTIQNRVYRPFKFFVLWYSLHISEMTAGLTWL